MGLGFGGTEVLAETVGAFKGKVKLRHYHSKGWLSGPEGASGHLTWLSPQQSGPLLLGLSVVGSVLSWQLSAWWVDTVTEAAVGMTVTGLSSGNQMDRIRSLHWGWPQEASLPSI